MRKITLLIPKRFLSKDFLDIEVAKGLGVRGDDLARHLRGSMQEIHRNNRNSRLFNKSMIFICKDAGESVSLIGSRARA